MTFFLYMLVYYSLFLAFDESLLSSCQALMTTSCDPELRFYIPPRFQTPTPLVAYIYISASSLG